MVRFYRVILLSFFCLHHTLIHAQKEPPKKGFSDFVFLDRNTVCLLTTTGQLTVAPIAAKAVSTLIGTDTVVIACGLDRRGNLVIGDANHQIKRFNREKQQWSTLATYTNTLNGIVFDSYNTCYLITNKGVVDIGKGATYFPDSAKYLNDQITNKKEWFTRPAYFLDGRDKLWLGFDHGEWGGDVFCFDTHNQTYLSLKMDSVAINSNPVSGFCEAQNTIYMSSGLVHFFTHGRIIEFKQEKARLLLEAVDRETPVATTRTDPKTGKKIKERLFNFRGGEYIGPVAYNPINNCLYFYSQNGIHRGDLTKNLSSIKTWQKVLKPMLQWTGGRPDAVGPAMNVLKMQFDSSGTLYFLTEHDGLGVYNGKQLRFIK